MIHYCTLIGRYIGCCLLFGAIGGKTNSGLALILFVVIAVLLTALTLGL